MWHPLRKQFFWFDILGQKLLSQRNGRYLVWEMDECASAAGWIDRENILIATQSRLIQFNLETNASETLSLLELNNDVTGIVKLSAIFATIARTLDLKQPSAHA